MRKATDQRDAQIISLPWTSLLPFHVGDVLCFEVKCFDVLMSVAGSGHVMVTSFDAMWWLVLCHVTWCNAMSWWWAALLQNYSVLQSITPVLPWTTKYYSSTTLYYKVLLQYYPVLQSTTQVIQSTTPVLLCTTKDYFNTTPYYKYYSVLHSTTPVLPCTSKYYSSTTLYYSSTTLYYKVRLQY